MAKIREREEEGWYHFEFHCPGCEYNHGFYMSREGYTGPIWNFNKDFEKPTVTPSILMKTSWDGYPHVCHSYITNGIIQFLPDCTHKLAGQTIELPNIE
jgi:hypothetical protein